MEPAAGRRGASPKAIAVNVKAAGVTALFRHGFRLGDATGQRRHFRPVSAFFRFTDDGFDAHACQYSPYQNVVKEKHYADQG